MHASVIMVLQVDHGQCIDCQPFNFQVKDSRNWSFSIPLTGDDSVEFSVSDVQVHGGYILHLGNLEGTLKVGDKVKCSIDEVRIFTLEEGGSVCVQV